MSSVQAGEGRWRRVVRSLRAFAKLLNLGSHSAVVKAVRTGRLRRSVGKNSRGQPVIVDVKLARQEWRANASRPKTHGAGSVLLAEAQRRVTVERWRGLTLANNLKAEQLVSADESRRVAAESAESSAPSCSPRLRSWRRSSPEEKDASGVFVILDRALREKLTACADAIDRLAPKDPLQRPTPRRHSFRRRVHRCGSTMRKDPADVRQV